MSVEMICPYCNQPARNVSGRKLYPHRQDLFYKRFWSCQPCGAYVGCHAKNAKYNYTGNEPLGSLANKELRRARSMAHSAFDVIWKDQHLDRTVAYHWLSHEMNIEPEKCHIGMMNVEECKRVVDICFVKEPQEMRSLIFGKKEK